MKITSIETVALSVPMEQAWTYGLGTTSRKDELLVFVDTDEEHTGIGVSYHGHAVRTMKSAIDHEIAPMLIGRDPLEIQEIWDTVWASNFHLGATAAMALSGIDIALWDLLGKAANLPLYTLLGGGGHTELPVYVGCMALGFQPVESLVAEASNYAEQGYRALKLRGGAGVAVDVRAAAAVREALPDTDIMVDANCAYNWQQAVVLARRLADLDVTWLEDPFDYAVPFHHQQMGELARLSDVAIASGGSIYTRFELQSLLEAGGTQYITPDVVKCGGISEAMKMAAMGSARGVLIAPHTVAGAASVANAHFTAAIPANVRSYMEWDPTPGPLQREVSTPPMIASNGKVRLPTGPGLGITVSEAALEKYPHIAEKGIVSDARGEAARIHRKFQ